MKTPLRKELYPGPSARTYFLFKIGCLLLNINLTLYKALIRVALTYVHPTWEHTPAAPAE
jgi:hypothetical protein